MRRFCIVVLATLALSVYSANIDPSACDCGYIDAADPSKNVYTDLFYFDFTNSSSPDVLSKFRYADYTVSRQSSPYARKYLPSLASVDDDGLHLKVTANVQSGAVESALSSTKNKNYRYGSYQMTGRVTNVTGTVSAFFIYHDDSSEVDMEYVSSDTSQMMRYSVKPQQYLDNGAAAATTYQTEPWNNGSFSDVRFANCARICHIDADNIAMRYRLHILGLSSGLPTESTTGSTSITPRVSQQTSHRKQVSL